MDIDSVPATNQAGEVATDIDALNALDAWAETHCADHDPDYIAKDDVVRYLAAFATQPATSQEGEAVATAKARLSIAAVRARNRGAERGAVEVIADDVAVLLAAHSDLDRQLSAATPTPPIQVEHLREALEWYADPANWWVRNSQARGYHRMGEGSMERHAGQPGTVTDGSDQMLRDQFIPDAGGRARAALAQVKAL